MSGLLRDGACGGRRGGLWGGAESARRRAAPRAAGATGWRVIAAAALRPRVMAVWLATSLALGASGADAQNPPEVDALLEQAAAIVARSDAGPGELRAAGYAEAARLLDQIVEENPDSDAAVDILLGNPVGSLNPTAIRTVAEQQPPGPTRATADPARADAALGASPSDQAALRLSGADWRELQVRLALLGFDSGGFDGLFGPTTRTAIKQWQSSLGLPTTGYLDAAQLAQLRESTARAYSSWQRRRLADRVPEQRPQAPSPNPTGRYVDERGCLREEDGAVVRGYRLTCF